MPYGRRRAYSSYRPRGRARPTARRGYSRSRYAPRGRSRRRSYGSSRSMPRRRTWLRRRSFHYGGTRL